MVPIWCKIFVVSMEQTTLKHKLKKDLIQWEANSELGLNKVSDNNSQGPTQILDPNQSIH